MSTVLVVRSECLRYSETFIREQMLACRRWGVRLVGNEDAGGLPLDGLNPHIVKGWMAGNAGRLIWRLGAIPPKVTDEVRGLKGNLIHVHFGTNAVEWSPVLARLNLPVIVTLHGYDVMTARNVWERKKIHTGFGNYPNRLLSLAKTPNVRFIAVSKALKARAVAFGIPEDKISVHYIGIDPVKFSPSPLAASVRPRRILSVGRMVEKKGGRYLIEAFARVRQTVPDAELVMVGAGPLLDTLKEQAATLNVPVTFTGSLPPAQVAEQMHAARVFCLPSITAADGDSEGFGLVILEAQACGVPVVTSALGGATEGLAEGETGFAFPERDVDALAGHLTRLLTDDALADRIAAAAPAFVRENFDVARLTGQLEDYYDDVSQRFGVRGAGTS